MVAGNCGAYADDEEDGINLLSAVIPIPIAVPIVFTRYKLETRETSGDTSDLCDLRSRVVVMLVEHAKNVRRGEALERQVSKGLDTIEGTTVHPDTLTMPTY
jgi:hypothetical protein